MTEWLRQNGWALIIAVFTIASTFSLYGYRIDQIEARQNRQEASIEVLQARANDVNVALAKIQIDIEYIKVQVTKLAQ